MLFIYNPNAGKSQIKSKLSDIIEIFVRANYEVTIYSTQCKQDATQLVTSCGQDYDIVVCSGGDGTLNEVTDGVMLLERKPRIGYLPAGTTNDFAVSHKIPRNILKAANVAVGGQPYYYDIGSMNREFFTYVAAFGAFTDVSYETSQTTKNMLGRLAYILEGVKRLPMLKSYHMTVEIDNKEIEDEFIFGMITNSGTVGGFRGFSGKHVQLDDGLFEVCFIKKPKNPLELQAIINALITKITNNNFIYSYHAAEVAITSKEEVPWTLDGEFGGNYKVVNIKIHKQAIAYMIDIEAEAES